MMVRIAFWILYRWQICPFKLGQHQIVRRFTGYIAGYVEDDSERTIGCHKLSVYGQCGTIVHRYGVDTSRREVFRNAERMAVFTKAGRWEK